MKRLALIAAAGSILTGCGGHYASSRPHYPVDVRFPHLVSGRQLNVRSLPSLPAFISPTRLAIATRGSSSCPWLPGLIVVHDPHRIRIDMVPGTRRRGGRLSAGGWRDPCTAKVTTTRMAIGFAFDPKVMDVHHPLAIHVWYGQKPEIWIAAPLGRSSFSRPPRKRTTDYPVIVHSPVVAPSNVHLGVPRESAQFLSPTQLRIVTRASRTLGSSSCPSVPDTLVVQSPHKIRIHLTAGSRVGDRLIDQPLANGECKAEYGSTAMVVAIDPKETDVHHPLTVSFFYGRNYSYSGNEPAVRIAAPLKPR